MSVEVATRRESDVTIVLVHGACHGAWCWEKVVPALEARGWNVVAVELPLTSLYADADVVRDAIATAKSSGQRVLLAGHSYGGFVISEGGHDADSLVFCAASLPDAGDSAASQFELIVTPELANAVYNSEDGTLLMIHPEGGVPAFYNCCTPEQVASAVARIRPMHVQALDEAVHEPAWNTVPSTYVVCARDNAMSPNYQRERAARLDEFIEIDTDHSLMYTATDEVVARLDELGRRLLVHAS